MSSIVSQSNYRSERIQFETTNQLQAIELLAPDIALNAHIMACDASKQMSVECVYADGSTRRYGRWRINRIIWTLTQRASV